MAHLPFDNCEVVIEPKTVMTVFDDHTFFDEPTEVVTKERLFYSSDIGYRNEEVGNFVTNNHILHTYLMEKFGFKYSPYFYNLAHGLIGKPEWERAIVLSFHKYLCIKVIDPILIDFKDEIKTLRKEALRMLRI